MCSFGLPGSTEVFRTTTGDLVVFKPSWAETEFTAIVREFLQVLISCCILIIFSRLCSVRLGPSVSAVIPEHERNVQDARLCFCRCVLSLTG